MPDLQRVCKTYLRKVYPDATDRSAEVPVNLAKLKACVVGDTEWVTEKQAEVTPEFAQKVTVERQDTTSDAAGTLRTAKNFRWLTEVEILSDVIKGLNCHLYLPLDPSQTHRLGDTVLIDMGRAKSTFAPNVPLDIQTDRKFKPSASKNVAHVTQDRVDYTGSFRCKVKLEGKVIFQHVDGSEEKKLYELCQCLKKEDLDELEIDEESKEVTFTLQGRVTFKGDYETINWQ